MDLSRSPQVDTNTALKLYKEIGVDQGIRLRERLLGQQVRSVWIFRERNGLTVDVKELYEPDGAGEMAKFIWRKPAEHVKWIQKAMARRKYVGYCWISVDEIPEPETVELPYRVHDESGLTWRCTRCGTGFEAGRDFARHVWSRHTDVDNLRNVLRQEEEQKTLMGWSQ